MRLRDFLHDRVVLFPARLEDEVVAVLADARAVRRDDGDIQFVDVVEFVCLGFRRAGHAAELLVQAEIILHRDRRERLGLLVDLDAFLRLDGLVEAVAPAAAGHRAPGVFIDDDDLALGDDVVDVLFVKAVRAEELRDVVDALALHIHVLLGLRLCLDLLLIRQFGVCRRFRRMRRKVRQDECIGIAGAHEIAALLGEVGLVGSLVDREEELLLELPHLLLAHVGVEGEFHLLDGLALLGILHRAEVAFVQRLAPFHFDHDARGILDAAAVAGLSLRRRSGFRVHVGLFKELRGFVREAVAEHRLLFDDLLRRAACTCRTDAWRR